MAKQPVKKKSKKKSTKKVTFMQKVRARIPYALRVVILICILVLAASLVLLLLRSTYNNGKRDGESVACKYQDQAIDALAAAVQDKTTTSENLKNLMESVPSEINDSGITRYIANLDKAIAEADNSDVKSILETYRNSWREFEAAYNANDADLNDRFDDLKFDAYFASEKIQTILNNQISTALNNL